MENGIVKVDYKKFELTEEKAMSIQKSFSVIKTDKEAIEVIYNQLIKAEITPEICEQAGELSTKLSKVNAKLNKAHKAEKQLFLRAGQFCDALKNREKVSIENMQETLKELKNYYIVQEQKRVAELTEIRAAELLGFMTLNEMPGKIGEMEQPVYDAYLINVKNLHDEKIKAERQAELERIEREAKALLHDERKEQLIDYWQFLTDQQKFITLSELTEHEFDEMLQNLKAKQNEFEAEQEKIKAENIRLQKEREEAERIEKATRLIEAEKLRKKNLKLRLEKEKVEKIRQAEQAKTAKLKAEIKAKEEAEKKEKEEAKRIEQERIEAEQEAKRKAEAAPDKEKLLKLAKTINSIVMPELSTDAGKTKLEKIKGLIAKTAKYTIEKAEEL